MGKTGCKHCGTIAPKLSRLFTSSKGKRESIKWFPNGINKDSFYEWFISNQCPVWLAFVLIFLIPWPPLTLNPFKLLWYFIKIFFMVFLIFVGMTLFKAITTKDYELESGLTVGSFIMEAIGVTLGAVARVLDLAKWVPYTLDTIIDSGEESLTAAQCFFSDVKISLFGKEACNSMAALDTVMGKFVHSVFSEWTDIKSWWNSPTTDLAGSIAKKVFLIRGKELKYFEKCLAALESKGACAAAFKKATGTTADVTWADYVVLKAKNADHGGWSVSIQPKSEVIAGVMQGEEIPAAADF